MDLMFALENLFSSSEAVGFKVSLRAACLLEKAGKSRKELFKQIKKWYRKRNKIAHGSGDKVVEWKDVEYLREVVRKAIIKVWYIKKKGDDLDDYLFLSEMYNNKSSKS